MLVGVTLLSALVCAAHALTGEQAASFFGASQQSDLLGSTAKLPSFDFSVVQNSTHVLFVVNATSTAPSNVGWFGTGHGTGMSDSDFLVAWPVVSGSLVAWTLSHRFPNGDHVMPSVASRSASTSSFYTLVPQFTTSDASSHFSTVAYVRARDPGASYPTRSGVTAAALGSTETSFIYASSSINPGVANEGASINQHDQPKGATSIDLSQPFSIAATAQDPQATGAAAAAGKIAGRSSKDKALIAHATLGSLAFLLFSPLAILIARIGRDSFRWFPAHWMLNLFSVVLVIICFALATSQVGPKFSDFHHKLGVSLLILVLMQALIGFGAHFTRPTVLSSARPSLGPPVTAAKPRRTFGVPRLVHVFLGLVTVSLGWTQIANGLFVEWPGKMNNEGPVPRGVKIVFWILVGVSIAAYVIAWIAGAVFKGHKGSDEGSAPGDNRLMRQTSS